MQNAFFSKGLHNAQLTEKSPPQVNSMRRYEAGLGEPTLRVRRHWMQTTTPTWEGAVWESDGCF